MIGLIDPVESPTASTRSTSADLRPLLAQHRGSRTAKSIFQLVSTLLLFAVGWLAMWWSHDLGYGWTLLLAIPTAGCAVRLFILQHDCGHGSFFRSAAANQWVGGLLGVLTLTPYQCWRRQHAMHHATNGQLDHRGMGDIRTMTVAEYQRATRWQRWCYRVYRHPLVLFGAGPFLYFVVMQRLTWHLPRHWRKERLSVQLTNLALLAMVVTAAWGVGPWKLAAIQLPIVFLAGGCGVWLFYIQHQFEPTYWEHDATWDHNTAAMHGSSHVILPWPLAWFTANIGLHHIHHLDSRIANYSLPECYRAHAQFRTAQRLTIRASLACTRLKLWDEQSRRLVRFSAVPLPARPSTGSVLLAEESSP